MWRVARGSFDQNPVRFVDKLSLSAYLFMFYIQQQKFMFTRYINECKNEWPKINKARWAIAADNPIELVPTTTAATVIAHSIDFSTVLRPKSEVKQRPWILTFSVVYIYTWTCSMHVWSSFMIINERSIIVVVVVLVLK